MFEIFDVKDLIKRISAKYHINDITLILNLFKISTFDVEIFLK